MGKKIFYGFILVYALIVVYDGFYGYLFKSKDEIISEAIVGRLDKNKNPIFQFEFKNQVFDYKDRYANKYMFVKRGDIVKIKYKLNKQHSRITNVEVIDFKYQILSVDKMIYHLLILLIAYLSINKAYSKY